MLDYKTYNTIFQVKILLPFLISVEKVVFLMKKFNNETEFVFSNEFIGFTTVPNHILNDKGISYKALGLYVQIVQFQNSPGHKIYMKTLEGCKTDRRNSVSSGMNELIVAGYLAKEQLRNEKGHLSGVKYTVYMKPVKPCNTSVPTDNGKPDTGDADTGKPTPKKKIYKKKIYKKKIKSVSQSVLKDKGIEQTDRQTDELQVVTNILQEQIHIEELKQSHDSALVGEIELNILEMYLQDRTTIRGEVKPKSLIQSVISKLNHGHIEILISKFNDISITTKIKNTKGYIQTMIYNAPFETIAGIGNDIRSKGLV